jgi:hypothetical protein
MKQVHLVIPEGTKVLTRSGGRVGVVSHTPNAPEHNYRVRFADAPEESFHRTELTIFKHVQAELPGGPDSGDLYPFVIYRCVVRSTAYGLQHLAAEIFSIGVNGRLILFRVPPAARLTEVRLFSVLYFSAIQAINSPSGSTSSQ